MTNLSYTKKFFMLAVNEKGKIPAMKSTEIHACLLAGGLMELMSAGIISKDEAGKITVEKKLDDEFLYLLPLYERIATAKKPKTVEKLAMDYMSSGKHMDQLVANFKISLISKNYKEELHNQGLFKNKTLYVPKEEAISDIVTTIREQFFGDLPLTDEIICVVSLLEASKLIHDYFGKFDAKLMKEKMRELPANGAHGLARKIIDETITMMVVMTAIIVS